MYGPQIKSVPISGHSRSTCWYPASSGWLFLPNVNNYVDLVNGYLDP
ncbi:MAG TPA: hypothetical protein VHY22_04015 [Chthoniobacteraceae bacterium]|jgi:hypothetical protein|nr:hypothetical protein [Chthoniobacteraceae bacterium]